ncbi:MAG: class I SAM-dependent methyltransferase [Chloroflexi bacterium]|nr:class I SAM-dependent methyltransferase [Chloroflexota bacterium]
MTDIIPPDNGSADEQEVYRPDDVTLPARSSDAFALLLGRTQGVRGSSEIMAGARADLTPSPFTLALSSLGGRITARTIMNMAMSKAAIHYLAARIPSLEEIVRRALNARESALLVDLAAGFSPLGLQIADEMPQVQVLEIDLPAVLQEKRKRLQKGRHLTIPPNIEWLEANLGTQEFHGLLEGRRPDVITYSAVYFTLPEQVRVARYLRDQLQRGGALVCMSMWVEGLRQVREANRFFRNQTSETPGVWESPEAAQQIFASAGFASVEVFKPSEIGEKLGLHQPIMDVELIALAQ